MVEVERGHAGPAQEDLGAEVRHPGPIRGEHRGHVTSLRQSQLTWLWCAAGCPAPATTAMSALVPGATPPSSTVTAGPQEDQDLDQSEVIIQCHVTRLHQSQPTWGPAPWRS